MSTLFSLQGRTAFITGGSTGIGAMIARGFLEHGATVIINARKCRTLCADHYGVIGIW